jgi:hypothetical protein
VTTVAVTAWQLKLSWDCSEEKNDLRTSCRYDKMAAKIGNQCKCLPKFSIGANKTGYANCHGEGVACAAKMGTAPEYEGCDEPCNGTTYEAAVTRLSKLPPQSYFVKSVDFCPLTARIGDLCNNAASDNGTRIALTKMYPDLCTLLQEKNQVEKIVLFIYSRA